MIITKYLNLKPEAMKELKQVNSYTFNVFNLRKFTDG